MHINRTKSIIEINRFFLCILCNIFTLTKRMKADNQQKSDNRSITAANIRHDFSLHLVSKILMHCNL